MSQEIYWLALTATMTGLFWVPYVLSRMAVQGPLGAMANQGPDSAPPPPWAARSRNAHSNAVENLVVFAPLVLIVQVLGISSGLTATACAVYFFIRLAHFIIQTLGIPGLRTVCFVVGWAVQMVLAYAILTAA